MNSSGLHKLVFRVISGHVTRARTTNTLVRRILQLLPKHTSKTMFCCQLTIGLNNLHAANIHNVSLEGAETITVAVIYDLCPSQ